MPIQLAGAVGPSAVGDGATPPVRQNRDGSLAVVESHGRYYEAAYRKNLFTAVASGTTLTAANTAYTGLAVLNPSGNSKNFVLQKTGGFLAVTSASTLGIALGYWAQGTTTMTNTTPVTVLPNFVGTGGSTAIASSSATTAASQTAIKYLLHNTAAIATTGEDPGWQVDLEGSIIVPPGYGVALIAVSAASAASALYADISWEEVPV